MQRNIVTDGNTERQTQNDHSISGFAMPNSTLGEALISFTCAQIPTSIISLPNSDQLWNNTPNPTSSYPPIQNIPSHNYPFECPRNVINSTFESMNYSYEGVPFDASINKWDFNKFATPQQLGVEQTGDPVLNEWISTDQRALNPFNNELSLSLATSGSTSAVHATSIHEQCSEMSSSSLTSFSLQKRPSEHTSCSSNDNNNNLSLSCNSYKPVQIPPFAPRFFHAMQEILAEIAGYALESFDQMSFSKHYFPSISDGLETENRLVFRDKGLQEREVVEAKMKHMISLLQLVDEQYNQCVDEIHTVISAFHAVTELDPNLHARFALPTISLMYKNLRERISSHILEMGACFNYKGDAREEESTSFDMSFVQKQWALQQLRKRDHQLWRPQRGLPERSVSVLRAWMFQNFLHPYPKDAEKQLLAMKSGLTRSQVSNWFINARVRLWKPMIEEMCAEVNRRKARRNGEELTDGAQRNYMRFENRR